MFPGAELIAAFFRISRISFKLDYRLKSQIAKGAASEFNFHRMLKEVLAGFSQMKLKRLYQIFDQ